MYTVLLYLFLPFFILIALTRKKLRKNLMERIFPAAGFKNRDKAIWIHAASVGEAVIAKALVDCLRQKGLSGPFVITTNTFYTRDLLRKKTNDTAAYSMPFDLPFSLRRFLRGSNPRILIIVETELWPNMLREACTRNIPVIIVNARISDSSFRNYQRFSFFFRRILGNVDLVLAQSSEAAERFIAIGARADRVINTGNIKYYRNLPDHGYVHNKENVITFGSVRGKEIEDIADTVQKITTDYPSISIYIAPRHLETLGAIEKAFAVRSMAVARLTGIRGKADRSTTIILVDTMGELMELYRKSSLAFVGGSLAPYGGHNVLEPLFFGTPVIFGPFMDNFRDIADMVSQCHAGITVQNKEELIHTISTLLSDQKLLEEMGGRGFDIVKTQNHQMEHTVSEILKIYTKSL